MKKEIIIKDILNVKIGDTLVFPSSSYLKTVKRKVAGFSIDAMRDDNIHVRIGYKRGKNIYFCLIEKLIELNPHLEQKSVKVKSFLREGEYKDHFGTKHKVFQECISIKDEITPIERPYYMIRLNTGKTDKWYINN